ncbi:putative bifunctional diguanylate cyclase/phosphodiesterase [Oleiagrimonas soli]|uniref:Diguanylate cyclase (GGDEF)-like protein n=1 Tax=Oleiagrimonas soli TaxID=1543381 RepID=A0A099CVZ4_9GAMM|nr:bifunctional diguanylate cyclase/phosphodiesterase [Oleiagrimonas soli]KGI78108.1 hypothetical protein LF63_0107060 [Oleiagrimonas soli]MBB6183457.1 diguanylate cyclase (GGDEF)-like protein [Oleiagrimonas soli]
MIDERDLLTGLPSRRVFLKRLAQRIIRTSEIQGKMALVVIDIAGFTQINIAHGYEAGDRALRHLAAQLREVARTGDFVARIGDNRFALVLTQVLNHGHVELAIHKLQRLLETPMEVGERQVSLRIRAGAALCPEHASHAEFLMRQAETALIAARREHMPYKVLDMHAAPSLELSEQWQLEMEFEHAIERGELRMHYQPQVHLRSGRPIGAEALMRWNRRDGDPVSPEVFIPIAERIGKIKPLTIWALNTALRQASEWPKDHGSLSISLNLPSELAIQPDLPELVQNALQLWGKPHIQLMLEISEHSLMDRHRGRDILMQLRALGVRISIDDFGTGYSCLAYFKSIPADELKIDKSFIGELLSDAASLDITVLIIELAHRFGLNVVAEGVENTRTLQVLRNHGCEIGQGYLFSRPLPAAAMAAWLREQPRRHAPAVSPKPVERG